MKTGPRDEDRMKAADLRLRTSTTIYGPLQLTIVNHRQGAELGYEAGIATYREQCNRTVEELMYFYLEAPRYRPRTCTQKIVAEWQAMFLLGWTSQLFEDMEEMRTNEPQREYEAQAEV
jgi:hypothetical protein